MIRVLVADDHAVVRRGLVSILSGEPGLRVVAEAADGAEAGDRAAILQPDVIVLDINMPRCSGLEALPAIKQKAPKARVLMLTVSADEKDLFTALRHGAQGYILKGENVGEVVSAVKRIAAGEVILSPEMARSLVAEFRQQVVCKDETALSPQELEVLGMVGEGLSNKDIAKRLSLAESTVRAYLSRLIDKLHLRNRTEAAAYATDRRIGAVL